MSFCLKMFLRLKSYLQTVSKLEIGNQIFLYGIFFLPSTSVIGLILLFFALIISIGKFKNSILRDGWNYPFLISIGLIISSTLNIVFFNSPYLLESFDTKIIWFNVMKWLILIICFLGFQNYLDSNNKRSFFSKFLIAGTLPVILSCFLHKFFWNEGPYQILNGLIVWFQKPLSETGGISGLFSNVNYTGMWLGLSLPFCIALARLEKVRLYKIILFTLILFFSYFILETNSRNAYLSLVLGLTFLIKFRYAIIFMLIQFSLIIFSKFIEIRNINIFGINFNFPLFNIIDNISSLSINSKDSRLMVYKEAISLVKERPFSGWGASTFNFNITNNNLNNLDILKVNPFHTHNLPLELAYNFGIPLALIIVTTSIIILFMSIKKLYKYKFNKEEFLINKAWITSILIIMITHLFDVTFYEDRIGIIICIFFSGLRCIIKEKNYRIKKNLDQSFYNL